MKLFFKSRSWHNWVAVILALPLLIVALTSVFIAHKKALGTESIEVAAGWLPGYRAAAKEAAVEARTTLATADGRRFVGTQGGLFELRDGRLVAIEALGRTPVRALAEADWGLVAATKAGIWIERNGVWQRARAGDAWSADRQPDGRVVVALKDAGLLESRDGAGWAPEPQLAAALAALPAEASGERLTLHKLVMDLHTGKAFFGKDGEWIWIDLLGLAMALLGLTGLWMWWRAEARKASLAGGNR
jgi:hypothetical protein